MNIKKISYLGYIVINGEIYRLPNCLHFYIGSSVSDVQLHLKANISSIFLPSFVCENHFQLSIINLITRKHELIEIDLPF